MNLIRFTLAVAWKELQVLLKDRGAMAIFLLMPLLIAGLMNAPQIANWQKENDEETQISFSMVVVNEDEGPYGEQITAALQGIDILETEIMDDLVAADRRVAEREVEAGVVIPAAFSRSIDAYEPARVQLIVDPTQEAVVGLVAGILDSVTSEVNLVGEIRYGIRSVLDASGLFVDADEAVRQGVEAQTLGVIMTQLNERRAQPAIAVVAEDRAGKTAQDLLNVAIVALMPGMAILFAFFVVTTLADSFYKEKEEGSFRRLLAAPIPRGAILAGKMIAYMVIVFLQIGIMIVVANVLFAMPIGESPLALFLLTLFLALSVTAVGMFITAFSRSKKQANAWAMIAAFALGALGGCFYGIPMPLVFRDDSFLGVISRLTPQGNAMEGYIRVLAEGAGVVDILPQLVTLLLITAVLYLVGLWRFRFE